MPNLEIKKVQSLLKKAIQLGIDNNDILPEYNSFKEYNIDSANEKWLKIPIPIVETLLDDHLSCPSYELIFCHHAPEQKDILNNHKIYLYKTKQSLEAVITRPSPNPTTKIITIDTAKIPQAQLTHIENALLHEQTNLPYPAYEHLADALIHQNLPIKGYHELHFTQAQTLEMLPPNAVNRHHQTIAIDCLEYSPAYKRSCLESDLYLSPSPSTSTASPAVSTTDTTDLSAMSKALLFALDNTEAEPEQSMQIAPKITTKATSISRKRKAPVDKSKSLSFTHQGIPWAFLGEGTYNKAYHNGDYVLNVSVA
ncbi:hypothetical protein DA717_14500, partial [Piscirickettsiaceae bacterium NZ-RLO2]